MESDSDGDCCSGTDGLDCSVDCCPPIFVLVDWFCICVSRCVSLCRCLFVGVGVGVGVGLFVLSFVVSVL
jgi:hypothetical protein